MHAFECLLSNNQKEEERYTEVAYMRPSLAFVTVILDYWNYIILSKKENKPRQKQKDNRNTFRLCH